MIPSASADTNIRGTEHNVIVHAALHETGQTLAKNDETTKNHLSLLVLFSFGSSLSDNF